MNTTETTEKTQVAKKNEKKVPLTPKQREVQRDNYSLIIAFLPLTGALIWLGLVLINALVIDQSKISWQNAIAAENRTIQSTYGKTLETHGELVIKTNQLSGVIEKDIQPEQVFILVESLFPQDPEFNVVGFGREKNGSFNVRVMAPTYIKFAKIARRFNQYTKVRNVQIIEVTNDTKLNQIVGTINFFFTSPEINSATNSTTTTN